jgi:hypothetical protein
MTHKAAVLVCELFIYLRAVFFQHSVVVQLKYPNLPVFKHPVFKTADWRNYAQAQLDRFRELAVENKLPPTFDISKYQGHNSMKSPPAQHTHYFFNLSIALQKVSPACHLQIWNMILPI